MTQIQIDPGLQQKLGGMTEPAELCDSSGKIVGHYLPESEYKEYKRLLYASFGLPLSEEEIDRRRAQTGGCSLQEIWKRLGRE